MNKFALLFLVVLAVAALFDSQVAQAAASIRSPVLDTVFLFFTSIATLFFGVVVIFVLALAWHTKAFWSLLVSFVIDGALVFGLKTAVARPRPLTDAGWWLDAESYSFPSGHASRAFALLGVLAGFYKKRAWLLYLTAFLVGVSRIYFGVHYASDVFVGALLGFVVSEAVLRLKLGEKTEGFYKRLKNKRAPKKR